MSSAEEARQMGVYFPDPSHFEPDDNRLADDIKIAESKFTIACQQLILLNRRVTEAEVRYRRAAADRKHAARLSLRFRLLTLEGVRQMFYDYATKMADHLDRLRTMAGMIVIREEDDSDLWSEEEEETWETGSEGVSDDDDDDRIALV